MSLIFFIGYIFICSLICFFIGYYLGRVNYGDVEVSDIAKGVGKDINKIKDLSFKNFKSIPYSKDREDDYDPDFTIEYYPVSEKYYAKYKKSYLRKNIQQE